MGKDIQKTIEETANLLIEKYVMSGKNVSSTFTSLFKNIQFTQKPEYVYNGLLLCLLSDPECYESWKGLYKNNILPSVTIIEYTSMSKSRLPKEMVK